MTSLTSEIGRTSVERISEVEAEGDDGMDEYSTHFGSVQTVDEAANSSKWRDNGNAAVSATPTRGQATDELLFEPPRGPGDGPLPSRAGSLTLRPPIGGADEGERRRSG